MIIRALPFCTLAEKERNNPITETEGEPYREYSPARYGRKILGSSEESEMGYVENTSWSAIIDDMAAVGAVDFAPQEGPYYWPTPRAFNGSSSASVELDDAFVDLDGLKESGSHKRLRSESSNVPGSKACREKMRRDRLNDRFLELGSILDPGKLPKMDKAAILSDAARMVTQLRSEAQKLKDTNENLQEKIKELKAEKNELRDEKQRMKAEKENLEQQVKALNARPSFIPPVMPSAAFASAAAAAAPGHKLMVPIIGYPGYPMWQLMPPTEVDTSLDAESCPPVA